MTGQAQERFGSWGYATSKDGHSFKHEKDEATARTEGQKLIDGPRCKECGDGIYNSYCEPIKTQLTERQLCFSCNFWTNLLAEKEKHLFVEHTSYQIGEEPSANENKSWPGFGGAKFVFKLPDGSIVTSHNVWCQGTVPEHFRDRLPDNAEIVK